MVGLALACLCLGRCGRLSSRHFSWPGHLERSKLFGGLDNVDPFRCDLAGYRQVYFLTRYAFEFGATAAASGGSSIFTSPSNSTLYPTPFTGNDISSSVVPSELAIPTL